MNFNDIQVNPFDGLPDHLVLLLFNKLSDAKSLSFAMCVDKRFNSIIPEVDSIFLSIPSQDVLKKSHERRSLFKKIVVRPLNFLLGFLKSNKSSSSAAAADMESCYFLPHQALKPFKSLRNLEVNLPKSNLEIKGSNLLKWRAEFGSQIKSCVLVGATSISRKLQETEQSQDQGLTDTNEDGFKLRVIWSLSCLIAASARHVLGQRALKDHDLTENLVIRDENNQGLVSMNKEQIQELKKSMIAGAGGGGENEEGGLLKRSKVPTLRMKMWYVPELELPESGVVMKGATLVVIKPVVGGIKKTQECEGKWVAQAFDDGEGEEAKVFEEAIRELWKKEKSCVLEINSF